MFGPSPMTTKSLSAGPSAQIKQPRGRGLFITNVVGEVRSRFPGGNECGWIGAIPVTRYLVLHEESAYKLRGPLEYFLHRSHSDSLRPLQGKENRDPIVSIVKVTNR